MHLVVKEVVPAYILLHPEIRRSIAAGLVLFVLTQKVPKKSSHPPLADSLPHRAFAAQTMKNLGLQSFCPGSRLRPPLHAKSCYALPTARPCLFFLVSCRSCPADKKGLCSFRYGTGTTTTRRQKINQININNIS